MCTWNNAENVVIQKGRDERQQGQSDTDEVKSQRGGRGAAIELCAHGVRTKARLFQQGRGMKGQRALGCIG